MSKCTCKIWLFCGAICTICSVVRFVCEHRNKTVPATESEKWSWDAIFSSSFPPYIHPLSSIRSQTMPSPSRPSWSCWHSTPSSTCYWYGTSRGCGLVAMASGSHSTSHCSRPTGWTGRHGVLARPGSPEGGGDRLELETPLSLSLYEIYGGCGFMPVSTNIVDT